MPDLYCPQAGCGKVTQYMLVKPVTCPKCQQPFAAAFKGVTASVDPTPARRQVPVAAPARKIMSVRPPPPRAQERDDTPPTRSLMMPLGGGDLPGFSPPSDPMDDPPPGADASFDDENASKEEVSAYAAQIQASIDPGAIRVDFGEQPIRLHSIIPPEARR